MDYLDDEMTARVVDVMPDFFEEGHRLDQKTGIVTRPPTPEEIAWLMKSASEAGCIPFDLNTAPAWVAELDGRIIGCAAARPVYEVVLFPVFDQDVPVSPYSGTMKLLMESCARWMRSAKNTFGAHYCLSVTDGDQGGDCLRRLGWKLLDLAGSKLFSRNF